MTIDLLSVAVDEWISLFPHPHSIRPVGLPSPRFSAPSTPSSSFYELSALDIEKKPVDFGSLRGKVVLVSNVASK